MNKIQPRATKHDCDLRVHDDGDLRAGHSSDSACGSVDHHHCHPEAAHQKTYSGIDLMRDLLPVLDNLERTILAAEHSGDFDEFLEGVSLVRDQFFNTLTDHGLQEVPGAWCPYNASHHETVGEKECNGHPDGSVMEVLELGYRMHDRLIRPSKVIVSRNLSNNSGERSMSYYVIIETDRGYTIAGVAEGSTAESVAMDAGGVLIDDARYHSYQEAQDVLMALPSPFPEKANE
ncbi:nucleotide exchange factor GrpE [Aporhodopirellula aestuarii]|uniref:Protein GrpE n=1 Tax=Aporhodopirellula aestuarii TaxID=2950107 RepID=A0ABT0U9Y8_9BACT|nr:nucleotide exchange factor GrpE [Aporhodopirellula aestuarii]MCM2373685.1 nucleotide exchange factor GrpE [Aporhodopirellula aestuarii]